MVNYCKYLLIYSWSFLCDILYAPCEMYHVYGSTISIDCGISLHVYMYLYFTSQHVQIGKTQLKQRGKPMSWGYLTGQKSQTETNECRQFAASSIFYKVTLADIDNMWRKCMLCSLQVMKMIPEEAKKCQQSGCTCMCELLKTNQ